MSMFPIATTGNLPANTGAFLFTDIPQNFTHLQLRIYSRSHNDGANYASVYLNPNSDGNVANYKAHYIRGDGSSPTSGSTTNSIYFGTSGSTATANVYGVTVIDILDYTNTSKYKTHKAISGWDANGSGNVVLGSVLWMSTNAITSFNGGLDGTLAVNTRIDLYGISTSFQTGV